MSGDSGSRSLTPGHVGADRNIVVAGSVLVCGYALLLLWVAAWLSCVVSGSPGPQFSLLPPMRALWQFVEPSAAWGQPVGPPWLYWSFTVVVLVAGLGLAGLAWRWIAHANGVREAAPSSYPGVAGRDEVARSAGGRALVRRAATLRPALRSPSARDV